MQRTLIAIMAMAGAATAVQADPGAAAERWQTVTVAEAANLPDDSKISVEGRIVRSLGDEEYEFQDDTGSMRVEIDDDDWDGQVNPEQRLLLSGELDRDANDIELDVERIRPASG